MDSFLKVKNLSGGYTAQRDVIKSICFEAGKGEFVGIIGPNGSGKSTLLRLMSRALCPSGGEIIFGGVAITQKPLKELYRSFAFVSQDAVISFSFSVEEIVLMGRIPHLRRLQRETKKDFSIAEQALSLTDTLHLKDKNIDQLSAGERQRVMIARALTQEPVVLFLDEPTSHLDIGHQIQIMDLMRKLNKTQHLTIIMVMHDLNLASEYCSRLILLNEGAIIKDGSPEHVLTYQTIEAVYKTIVVVHKNPISSKPYITLVSGGSEERRGS